MLETSETKFVEARGTKYAYRSVGKDVGNLPLVFMQHFTGTMDGWDPLVVNGLAKNRLVVVFDNAGVASSSGTTPDNVAQMAIDAHDFISALGLEKVDLLGYSLGGMVAQQLVANHPDLARRILLVGTAPRGGEEHLLKVLDDARSQPDLPDPRLDLFFTKSKASRAAGLAFLDRSQGANNGPRSGRQSGDHQRPGEGSYYLVCNEGSRQFNPERHPPAGSDREREQRHHAAGGQFLFHVPASARRAADPLP